LNTDEFRAKLSSAVAAGAFVPVLGAQVSCAAVWANSPSRDYRDLVGQQKGRSVQALEIAETTAIVRQIAAALSSPDHWLHKEKVFDKPIADPYLESYLRGIPGSEGPADAAGAPAEEATVATLELHLRVEITALSFVLTRLWTDAFAASPQPLRARLADEVINSEMVGYYEFSLMRALMSSLDACHALWVAVAPSEGGTLEEPPLLKLEWVYEKLLVLASRAVADSANANEFWSGQFGPSASDGFAGRHGEFVRDREHTCGWKWPENRAYPIPAKPDLCGIRSAHVLWVEALREHCILSGSRAYRTIEQVVFLLALDDAVDDLLNVTVDPPEIGLVYREQLRRFEQRAVAGAPDALARDIGTLRSLYEHCGRMPDGSVRPPDALHRSLAKLLARSHSVRLVRAQDAGAPKGSPKRPRGTETAAPPLCREVVLNMAMDLEMERAIEEQFPRYRVLVPARMPIETLDVSDEEDPLTLSLDGDYWATWCLGQFDSSTSRGGKVAEKWCWFDGLDGRGCVVSVEGDGPLIVKLFGSPVHELPSPARHRIVMDESDLLRLLQDLLPRKVKELDTVVRTGEIYFFGQGAATWSERTPFYMMARHHGEPQNRESREGDTRGSEGVVAAMDVGRLRIEGASALRSLNIDWPQAEELHDIAFSVVAEAFK